MRKETIHHLRNNRGVTLVFVALGLVIFLMFIGLCLDVGWMVYVRGQGQTRVDAAALAAAAALKEQDKTVRHNDAQTLADAFANSSTGMNMVVDSNVDPPNFLTPMSYNLATGEPPDMVDWDTANAVQVTNVIPTPLFFSGIRNVFGATETGPTNINVGATAYLGCPKKAQPTLPIALCADFITFSFPGSCGETVLKVIPIAADGAFFGPSGAECMTGTLPELTVGKTTIDLNNDDSPPGACRDEIKRANPPPGLVPVYSGGCATTGTKEVVGFAYLQNIRVERMDPDISGIDFVRGELGCNVNPGRSGGQCFGVSATVPLLVQ